MKENEAVLIRVDDEGSRHWLAFDMDYQVDTPPRQNKMRALDALALVTRKPKSRFWTVVPAMSPEKAKRFVRRFRQAERASSGRQEAGGA